LSLLVCPPTFQTQLGRLPLVPKSAQLCYTALAELRRLVRVKWSGEPNFELLSGLEPQTPPPAMVGGDGGVRIFLSPPVYSFFQGTGEVAMDRWCLRTELIPPPNIA